MNVILANGSYPSAPAPLAILAGAERVICCDGAAVEYVSRGGVPDVVIGDLDSVPEELRHTLGSRVVHVAEQDTNDLSKAFRHCLEQGWDDVVILGATGKREDHTIGNISLLADFAEKMPGIRMVTDDGEFFVARGRGVYSSVPGQEISLFALEPGIKIYSGGLMYPLDGLAPSKLWQATLNVALSTEFMLDIADGRSIIVYRANP